MLKGDFRYSVNHVCVCIQVRLDIALHSALTTLQCVMQSLLTNTVHLWTYILPKLK